MSTNRRTVIFRKAGGSNGTSTPEPGFYSQLLAIKHEKLLTTDDKLATQVCVAGNDIYKLTSETPEELTYDFEREIKVNEKFPAEFPVLLESDFI